MHRSIATIASPEFINLQPTEISPLISKCDIKVLYVGENRNRSYITKEVATEMSKTLRGNPIVGAFKEDKEDFIDHGQQIVIENGEVKFNCLTKPYGFVDPLAKVWFQKFEDFDEFGNSIEHEYLMTTGYLWTGQFPECADVIESGRPQSMELDEDTLNGHWAKNSKSNIEFFIINDAIFSKLCILGNDVEPCFEGANVTSPDASTKFALDDNFTKTLYSMMQDLQNFMEGGKSMDLENNVVLTGQVSVEGETNYAASTVTEVAESNILVDSTEREGEAVVEYEASVDSTADSTIPSTPNMSGEQNPATLKHDPDDDDEDGVSVADSSNNEATESAGEPEAGAEATEEEASADEAGEVDYQAKYTDLATKYAELDAAYTALKNENAELLQFKKSIDDAEKDKLIDSFYMLSEEDKADIRANKSNYSLDEIKAKLSVIYVEQKVNFDLESSAKNESQVESDATPITTYNLDSSAEAVPAYIAALRRNREMNK